MPYNGEFHFTALRTLGTFRTMSASRRFPTSRFQPGIPAMYACTGASPPAFAMRGLPPERTTASFSPFRTLIGLASLAPGLAFALTFGVDLAFMPARFILPLSADAYASQLCKQGLTLGRGGGGVRWRPSVFFPALPHTPHTYAAARAA